MSHFDWDYFSDYENLKGEQREFKFSCEFVDSIETPDDIADADDAADVITKTTTPAEDPVVTTKLAETSDETKSSTEATTTKTSAPIEATTVTESNTAALAALSVAVGFFTLS